ncbi:elongation factor P [Spiroplasma endosymbiont of 'Nebria riversi']|uniref:elongation factor P n=1 Tax=Spiroplasma endosymbiont of 'Nebria riversi' TaxID=2792084 RepID=UPI001C042629|nr:elongation factor P [Spiroplasma endosymbiont of 'Nebria riversi']
MINVNDLRNGMTFIHSGNLFLVLDTGRAQSGRGQANVKAKVKNLRSNAIINLTFTSGDKFERAHLDKRVMQYLYSDGNNLIFMDNESYEQVEINKTKMAWELKFLTSNLPVQVLQYDNEILTISLPYKVTLKIIEAEQAVKGDSGSSPSKRAVAETGLALQVPLFINTDDYIVVSTVDGKYQHRS